jgi:hypothetical protein
VQLLEKTQDMHKSIYQSKAPDAGNRSRTGGSSENGSWFSKLSRTNISGEYRIIYFFPGPSYNRPDFSLCIVNLPP